MTKGITIAGGGLAGLSLGVGLRMRGVPVVLHEAGRYPRHRVCGEFISGVQATTLESLGVAEDLADAHRHVRAKWFREGDELLDAKMPQAALGISRYRLDARLRDRLVGEGAELVEDSRCVREPGEGLVWAAGRLPKKGGWIGLKCHLMDFPMRSDLEMHLGSNGYAGLAPVEEGRVNVCGLFKLDRRRRGKGSGLLRDYLRQGGNGGLVGRMERAVVDESSFLGVSAFELGWQGGEESLCTLGDAEGMIPPFTGNGMSMAFESAELALEPLERWSQGKISWEAVVREIRERAHRKFRRRVANAMLLHKMLLDSRGQRLISVISKSGLLPFRPLLSLVR
ncbi:NAD(P)/FAD-dependent oxidoreductase [Haloferula chungangensis]|uniref:NAD(P)/FAD-dependent oxidoreductase n=1 Tax=Haloferula chungangensis TaxID=1048331 RepID=A0ABW2LBV6_9BACT